MWQNCTPRQGVYIRSPVLEANLSLSVASAAAGALKEVAELVGEDVESLKKQSRLSSDIHLVKLT